jgi:hypothetical protein
MTTFQADYLASVVEDAAAGMQLELLVPCRFDDEDIKNDEALFSLMVTHMTNKVSSKAVLHLSRLLTVSTFIEHSHSISSCDMM